jgi:hypothetical protein
MSSGGLRRPEGAELPYRRPGLGDPPAPRPTHAPAPPRGLIARCRAVGLELTTDASDDLVCNAVAATRLDLTTIEAIARVALAARIHERRVRLEHAPRRLVDLLELCGLAALGGAARAAGSVEAGRQAEQREEALGVEEERDAGDPVALDLEDLERPR